MIAALLWTTAFAGEAETEPRSASDQARRLSTAGAIEVSVGSVAAVGGLALMLVGRGEPGGISEEDNATHDLRTIGGSLLVIGGLVTVAIGVDSLSRSAKLREQAGETTVQLSPLLLRRGGGVSFDLTF